MTSSSLAVAPPSSLRSFPGPRGRFLTGSLVDAWENPLALFTKSSREHGDFVRFRFAWIDYYLLNDAQAAHRVLVENARGYHKSPNYGGLKVMLGEGLLTSEGDHWRRQRKLAQPAFHRDRLATFVSMMSRATADMLDRWPTDHPIGEPFDLHAEMMRLTFRIVGLTLLGSDLESDAREFGDALNVALKWANEYVESILRIPPWVPTPKNLAFRRAQRAIEGVVGRVVASRRAEPEGHDDLLAMLMGAREEGTDVGMTDRQLMDELLTLTLAGHETTANALSFTFYLLSRHPDVRRKLVSEVDSTLSGRTPELADLARMPYTRAVIDEALRLFPPAWIVERISLEADQVADYAIPKGSIVGVSPFAIHRNPRYWPNPEGFDPERFLSPDKDRPKLAYMPFGAGPRTCIGNAFAMMEMQIIVAMMAQRGTLDLAPGFELALDPSVTLRPKHGIPVSRR